MIEHFEHYIYGVNFQVILDHEALASVLKLNRGNKTFSTRLARWVNCLLPFKIGVIHAPDRLLGFADYLSCHPSEIKGHSVQAEQLWNDWFTVNSIAQINACSENETTPSDLSNPLKLPRALNSVLRVENEQYERQAAKAKEEKGNEPINSRESHASVSKQKTIVANKLLKASCQLS